MSARKWSPSKEKRKSKLKRNMLLYQVAHAVHHLFLLVYLIVNVVQHTIEHSIHYSLSKNQNSSIAPLKCAIYIIYFFSARYAVKNNLALQEDYLICSVCSNWGLASVAKLDFQLGERTNSYLGNELFNYIFRGWLKWALYLNYTCLR